MVREHIGFDITYRLTFIISSDSVLNKLEQIVLVERKKATREAHLLLAVNAKGWVRDNLAEDA